MELSRAQSIWRVLEQRYSISDLETMRARIVVYPSWLTWKILIDLEAYGLAIHEFNGPATYAATTWFILL